MDNSYVILIEFTILMVAISVSRTQTRKALGMLSSNQQLKVKEVTGNSINQLIPILILLILFYMVKAYFPEQTDVMNYSFAGIMVLYLIINGVLLFRKLNQVGLPLKFTQAYTRATSILYVGAAIFAYLAVTNPL